MSSSKPFLSLALFFAFALCAATDARAQQPAPKPEATPSAQQDDSVTEKGFRNKIIEIKHVDPNALYGIIQPLRSGFRGSSLTFNRELKLIAVRDFPENIATIEEAIKRLDRPEPPRPDIEFRIHIILATNNPQQLTSAAELPADLADVMKQLQTTLSYKSYRLMTSQVLRGKEGSGALTNKGVAEFRLNPGTAGSDNPIFYQYRLSRVMLEQTTQGGWKMQISSFDFGVRIPVIVGEGRVQYEEVGFSTPIGMKEGEKVVVGTTTMQDKGIIVILTANVIK